MLHAPSVFGVMASAMSSKSSDANFLFTFFSKSSNYLKTTRLKKRQVCNFRTILPSIACDQAFYFILFCLILEGEQGWRSECARLSQLALFDSIPVRCHIWVEIVVGSRLVPRVFSRYSEFPPSKKFP